MRKKRTSRFRQLILFLLVLIVQYMFLEYLPLMKESTAKIIETVSIAFYLEFLNLKQSPK